MKLVLVALVLLFVSLSLQEIPDADNLFNIGVGKADITGPAADLALSGYGNVGQTTKGIHQRLWARAFIVAEKENPKNRVVYVNLDAWVTAQAVKITAVDRLNSSLYHYGNVMISAIHSHATSAGYDWYMLYNIATLGFSKQNFEAIVNGIVTAIKRAEESLSDGGRILMNTGKLQNANHNRSPTSYDLNPEDERKKYVDGNTQKLMTTLRFEDANGKELGALSWFPVHCTSLSVENRLISPDNKGFVEYLFETKKKEAGLPNFVAAFAQGPEGDVTPHLDEPTCPDGKTPCSSDTTCKGKTALCTAKGPGKDMFESVQIIGTRQAEFAMKLYNDVASSTVLRGPIAHRHQFISPADTVLNSSKICTPAYGYSFAAGTSDGPGPLFKQGRTHTNPLIKVVTNILTRPTKEQENCQTPKPILANLQGKVGSLDMVPRIVPFHVIRIGQLILCGVPGEPTTMVGRRMQRGIESVIKTSIPDAHVVVAGLSNAYAGYITTPEEYKNQRYEGASTLFGPLQSVAYIHEFTKLAKAIVENKPVEPGPTPQKHGENLIHLSMPRWVDIVPPGLSFGHVKKNVRSLYKKGDNVVVKFYGGHPANNLMTDKSFLTVERKNGDKFEVVLTDNDWDTKFKWTRKFLIESTITIEWRIGEFTPVLAGTYVIRHFGYRKHLDGSLQEYSGLSSEFVVV